MSEREYRKVLRDVCSRLDRGVRLALGHGVRRVVVPSVIGASLAMTACAADPQGGAVQDAEVHGTLDDDAGPLPDVWHQDDIVYWPDPGYGVDVGWPDQGIDSAWPDQSEPEPELPQADDLVPPSDPAYAVDVGPPDMW